MLLTKSADQNIPLGLHLLIRQSKTFFSTDTGPLSPIMHIFFTQI